MGIKLNYFIQDFLMKQEIANTFLAIGKINGWNQVNGITIKLSFILSFVLFFSVFTVDSQEKDFKQGRIIKVLGTNSFVIEKVDSGGVFFAEINDTEAISPEEDKYSKAIEYLTRKVLEKEIYFTIEKTRDSILDVSIIYDCIPNDNELLDSELPCLSASYLDIEVIKNGFVKYVGNNEHLKKLKGI